MGKKAILILIYIIASLTVFSQNIGIWGLEYGEGSRDCLTYVKEETGLTGVYSEKDATITYPECQFYDVKVQDVVLYFEKNAFTRAEVVVLPKEEFVTAIYEQLRLRLIADYGNPTEDNFPNSDLNKSSTLWNLGKGKDLQTIQLAVEPITINETNINIYYSKGKVEKKVFEAPSNEPLFRLTPSSTYAATTVPEFPIIWGLEMGGRIEDVYNKMVHVKKMYPEYSDNDKQLTYKACIFAGEWVEKISLDFERKKLIGGNVRLPKQERQVVLATYKRLKDKLIAKYGKPYSERIYYDGKQPYIEEEGYGIPEIEKKKQEKQEPDLTRATWIVGRNDGIKIELNIKSELYGERHVSLTYKMNNKPDTKNKP